MAEACVRPRVGPARGAASGGRLDRERRRRWTTRPFFYILLPMSMTLYYVLLTLLLGTLVGVLLGGGFAFGCRLSELDRPSEDAQDS